MTGREHSLACIKFWMPVWWNNWNVFSIIPMWNHKTDRVFAGEVGWLFTQWALINILIAGRSKVSRRAGTEVISADGVGVTIGAFLTGVADAGVVQLAQQSWCTIQKMNFVIPDWTFSHHFHKVKGHFPSSQVCTQVLVRTTTSVDKAGVGYQHVLDMRAANVGGLEGCVKS